MTGEVLLEFSIYDPIHTSATPQQILQKLTGITAESADDNDTDSNLKLMRTDSAENDDEDDDDEQVGDESEDPTQTSETPEKRKRRLKLAKVKRRAKQKAYEFSGMSDLAGVVFLEISNIKDLPPEKNSERKTRRFAILFYHRANSQLSLSDQNILRHGPLRCHFTGQEDLQD